MAVFGSPLGQYVDSFVSEVEDDLSAPAQSRFQEGMQTIKKNVLTMEEVGCDPGDREIAKLSPSLPLLPSPDALQRQELCEEDDRITEGGHQSWRA